MKCQIEFQNVKNTNTIFIFVWNLILGKETKIVLNFGAKNCKQIDDELLILVIKKKKK